MRDERHLLTLDGINSARAAAWAYKRCKDILGLQSGAQIEAWPVAANDDDRVGPSKAFGLSEADADACDLTHSGPFGKLVIIVPTWSIGNEVIRALHKTAFPTYIANCGQGVQRLEVRWLPSTSLFNTVVFEGCAAKKGQEWTSIADKAASLTGVRSVELLAGLKDDQCHVTAVHVRMETGPLAHRLQAKGRVSGLGQPRHADVVVSGLWHIVLVGRQLDDPQLMVLQPMADQIVAQAVYSDISTGMMYRYVRFASLDSWLQMKLDLHAHQVPVEVVCAWTATRLPPCLRPQWDLPARSVICMSDHTLEDSTVVKAAYQRRYEKNDGLYMPTFHLIPGSQAASMLNYHVLNLRRRSQPVQVHVMFNLGTATCVPWGTQTPSGVQRIQPGTSPLPVAGQAQVQAMESTAKAHALEPGIVEASTGGNASRLAASHMPLVQLAGIPSTEASQQPPCMEAQEQPAAPCVADEARGQQLQVPVTPRNALRSPRVTWGEVARYIINQETGSLRCIHLESPQAIAKKQQPNVQSPGSMSSQICAFTDFSMGSSMGSGTHGSPSATDSPLQTTFRRQVNLAGVSAFAEACPAEDSAEQVVVMASAEPVIQQKRRRGPFAAVRAVGNLAATAAGALRDVVRPRRRRMQAHCQGARSSRRDQTEGQ